MMVLADKQPPKPAPLELQVILKKPYKDVCDVCKGEGKITNSSNCPKCKGSGQRLVRLL